MLTSSLRGKLCALILLAAYIIAGMTILLTATNHHQRESKYGKNLIDGRIRTFNFEPSSRETLRRRKMQWCRPLKFLNDNTRPVIALASFPGSGNTWLRYLLQQATGINTGSVYKDFGLLKNGFPGEYVVDSSVVVVKTHETGPVARRGYHKAVLLVRDPKQAIQAEFNRQGGGHVGFASPDRYKIKKGKYWEKFVDEQIIKWKEINLDWVFNFTNPTLVVFYDQLINDLGGSLRRLLKFLEVEVTESQLQCALERREGIYRRKKRMINLDPFTREMTEKIETTKREVYFLIKNHLAHKEKMK